MKKILVWLKKRTYIILLIVCGIGYFAYSGNWQVYAQPLKEAEGWCRDKWMQLGGQTTDMSVMEEEMQSGQSASSEGIATSGSNVSENGNGVGLEDAQSGKETGVGNGMQDGDDGIESTVPAEELTYRNPEDVIYMSVTDDYFADAVFIGDSRTVGMYEYGELEEISTFYASTGLTVYKMFDSPIIKVPEQRQKQTVEEALQANSFAKIYLMIGINEMGTGTVETFIAKYREAVEHLRELQPDAVIYLQGIMKVTTERSEQGDYINNEGIEARNAEIAKLADNIHVYYLDVNPLICDETGGMEPSYTFDGVHLKAQYISIWKDYLKEHAVEIP